MDRSLYLKFAADGLRMPIGTDMLLHEHDDAEAILLDGRRLGMIARDAAARYRTPLAMPIMDLRVEKEAMLRRLDVPSNLIDTHHFTAVCDPSDVRRVLDDDHSHATPRQQANNDAIRWLCGNTALIAVGMAIGPFSLATKLMVDPITAVYLAGTGAAAADEPDVALLEQTLAMSLSIICDSIRGQVAAGAKAVCVCEPAANQLFISPHQMTGEGDVFDRYVMKPNLVVRQLLGELGADLMFHDCGELTDEMVRRYNVLDPAILSLGASRKLWEDARLVRKDTVLFGNLPTKKFYSDSECSLGDVETRTRELLTRMRATNHPFILGSECDVLSVPEHHDRIKAKLNLMLNCRC